MSYELSSEEIRLKRRQKRRRNFQDKELNLRPKVVDRIKSEYKRKKLNPREVGIKEEEE